MNKVDQMVLQLMCWIDEKINLQLNRLLHGSEFQRLESSWRGIWGLIGSTRSCKSIVIQLLSVSLRELYDDMAQTIELKQNTLFKLLYDQTLNMPGSEPFGLLIGDYYFSVYKKGTKNDRILLSKLGAVAERAFVPFISGMNADRFDLGGLVEFPFQFAVNKLREDEAVRGWKIFRREEEVRFVGLVLPRVLMRRAYNRKGIFLKHRFFREMIKEREDYLWGNACYVFAASVANFFNETGGFSGQYVCEVMGVNYVLTDQKAERWLDWGFMPLCYRDMDEKSGFSGVQSIYDGSSRLSDKIGSGEVLSSHANGLAPIFCVSRFAHYVKAIMRNKVGCFMTAEACQRYLSEWFCRYCADRDGLSDEMRACYPLREVEVLVKARSGEKEDRGVMAGQYDCVLFLTPQYQSDRDKVSLKLVSEIRL
jgi:type VI secretion system protein ImpD